MSDTVLKVENLYKRYRLGIVNHKAFIDDVRIGWAKLLGKPDPTESYVTANELANAKEGEIQAKYVWALQDINLEVKQGEILGIIGKNGAGKSTLLKILSKTTAPTKGQVKVKGRVASLLEVGTGFHPELTGRENIYLNGMILGMKKREIDRKLDEIIDFAGVATFIDTPTKRYSSGMKVRLGFAVAAHLEPDILIVDEVLAVGDAEFQKKAIGKMKEVSKGGGRTVLFVSHDMNKISTLTNRSLLLKEGKIESIGNTTDVINSYLNSVKTDNLVYSDLPSNIKPKITQVELDTSLPNNFQRHGEPMSINITIDTPYAIESACISIQVLDSSERNFIHIWNLNEVPFCYKKGTFKVSAKIPKVRLYMGKYYLKIHFSEPPGGNKFQTLENICPFEVVMYEIDREFKWVPETCAYIEESHWNTEIVN